MENRKSIIKFYCKYNIAAFYYQPSISKLQIYIWNRLEE